MYNSIGHYIYKNIKKISVNLDLYFLPLESGLFFIHAREFQIYSQWIVCYVDCIQPYGTTHVPLAFLHL